ncbi:MAG: porphobilinogen synthase [Candidatus Caldatribacteriaceae bacterium]
MNLLHRLRRLRQNPLLREMVRETALNVSDLIMPIFVVEGKRVKEEIRSLPGIYRYSVDMLPEEIKRIQELGIPAVLLFGISDQRDFWGSSAWEEDGLIQNAIRTIKATVPIIIITDVCLCGYTDHGHCGVVRDGKINNDETVKILARIALSHAKAGADIVAPSDMMDGRVYYVRKMLDEADFQDVLIMSYSVKYASCFYGPFREAMNSAPRFGDRLSYQMDPGNIREALREVTLDIEEGADIVMVKPALGYLDVISKVKERFLVPLAAYSVSGEYVILKYLAKMGFAKERDLVMEMMISLKRAGADLIITYYAQEIAQWLAIQ